MRKDIVIDEIRAVRHKISEEFGHDTKALLDHHRELEKQYKDRMLVGRTRPGRASSAEEERNEGNPD